MAIPPSLLIAFGVLAFAVTPADAARKKHHRHAAPRVAQADEIAPAPDTPDDLYRRRGYGQGGIVLGGGQGGLSMAGACADLAFARPLPCEPGGGYGLYGNGLGYPFGF